MPYSNSGTGFAGKGNHGWTLDPPRLTDESDRGTGDPGSPRTAVDPRHDGLANVVFCDGHAEAQRPEALGYRKLANGAYADLDPLKDAATNRFFGGVAKDVDPPELPE